MHHHSHSCSCSAHTVADRGRKSRLLWIAIGLIGSFAIAEWGVGLWSHSLSLVADAGHMASDSLALVLALGATWIAQRRMDQDHPSQNHRAEVLAALVNGLGLIAIALWIGWEAITRLQAPPTEILSLPMLVTAGVGLGVNSVNVAMLHDSSHHDLNLRGAFLHVMADALSSIGVILAAIAVGWMHWLWADGAISLLVSGFIFIGALPLIHQSLALLWQPQPKEIETPFLPEASDQS